MNTDDIVRFPNIHPSSFQHPFDVGATDNLRKVPLLPSAISWLTGNTMEKMIRQTYLANSIRLSSKQGGKVYETFRHAASVLDVKFLPEIYIQNNPTFNAYAIGVSRPMIVLTSSIVDALNEDQLLAVVGHELGHIKCEHMLHKTVCNILSLVGLEVIKESIPGLGSAAAYAIAYAMANWSRKAELSCDRAGLLVCQNIDAVTGLTIMLAAGSQKVMPELCVEEVMKQAEDLEEIEEGLMGKLLVVNELQSTHPVPVMRLREIQRWHDSGEYKNILAGKYTRTGTEGSSGLSIRLDGPVGRRCSACESVVPDDTFCSNCNASLTDAPLACGSCGHTVKLGQNFCEGCGSPLQTTA
jgi:Zn-dependent protease with chaperone function/RNA polymerase subunit RPABC4/transcription elongation factor Spt4